MALVYVRSILAIVLCLAGALAYWFGYSAILRGDVFGVPFEAIELAQAQALKFLELRAAKPGTPMASSGETCESQRRPLSGLQLVQRRLRVS